MTEQDKERCREEIAKDGRYGMIDVSDDEKIVQFNGTLYMTEKCFERVRKAVRNE